MGPTFLLQGTGSHLKIGSGSHLKVPGPGFSTTHSKMAMAITGEHAGNLIVRFHFFQCFANGFELFVECFAFTCL